MTARDRLLLAVSPPAAVSKRDTSLRFTDILFGFVIREIFVRLQEWNELEPVVQWQLVTSGMLVLGSWVGFRRSLNRSDYDPKFVNLPFLRFVLDQLMIVLVMSGLTNPGCVRMRGCRSGQSLAAIVGTACRPMWSMAGRHLAKRGTPGGSVNSQLSGPCGCTAHIAPRAA